MVRLRVLLIDNFHRSIYYQHEITGENSNASGGDNHFSKVDETVPINPMVLLVRIKHIDGRLMEPKILTENTFRELCLYTNLSSEPYAVEILSPHEICIGKQNLMK